MSSARARLTAYFGERDRSHGTFLADRTLAVMASAGLERSAVLRGSEGFGNKHRLQSSSLLSLSEDLPMVTLGVGIRNQVERAAGEIRELAPEGLVTVEPVESPAPAGTATGIQVWLRRGQKLGSEPAHVGVVRLLARHGAAAAVCLLGVDGTTGIASRAGQVLLLERKRADGRARRWRAGCTVALRRSDPGTAARGRGRSDRWRGSPPDGAEQRLTMFGTEVRDLDGRPLHSTLVRTARESGGSGASVLTGIYGFTGPSKPRGRLTLSVATPRTGDDRACRLGSELRPLGGGRAGSRWRSRRDRPALRSPHLRV